MKVFLTVRDIEDLAARGVTQLPTGDDIVLTDLAREKAAELGIGIIQGAATRALPPSTTQRPGAAVVPLAQRAPLRETPKVGSKPRGCLHGHIETGRVAPGVVGNTTRPGEVARGSSSDPILDQLVARIRQLSK